jgi:hypothetical protein
VADTRLFRVDLPLDQIPVQVRETFGYKLSVDGKKALYVFPEEVLYLEQKQAKWLGEMPHSCDLEVPTVQAAIYCDLKAKGKFLVRSLIQPNVFHVFATKQAFNQKDKTRDAETLNFSECFDIVIVNEKLDLASLKQQKYCLREGRLVLASVRGASVIY